MNKDLRRSIFIVPSLITCGNMAFGLVSTIASIEGYFIRAAWFLVCALACDILDGRIARMTHTQSKFGAELDSLSDLVSFAIAPAIMIYMLVLNSMGRVGIAITALYVLCGALRLARFNVLAQNGKVYHYFVGLPTPASAGVLLSFILSYELLGPAEYGLNFKTIPVLMQMMPAFFKAMPLVMIALSFLMVSNVPYYSFKNIKMPSGIKAIRLLVTIIVLVLLVLVFPQNIFFIIFSVYALSGILMYPPKLIKNIHSKNARKKDLAVLDRADKPARTGDSAGGPDL